MSRVLSLAGFQVTIIGRFWVTAEDLAVANLPSDENGRKVISKVFVNLKTKHFANSHAR